MTVQNEKLKRRLVGAIVLTALAVIFLPMLFDEEVKQGSISTRKIPEFPKESEENILEIPTQKQIAERIIQPESRLPGLTGNSNKQLKTWVVQVGSFAKKTNARELRNKLRKAGFAAFVETVDEAKGKLFRVRVGPELSRESAEKIQTKIVGAFEMKGVVVPYQ